MDMWHHVWGHIKGHNNPDAMLRLMLLMLKMATGDPPVGDKIWQDDTTFNGNQTSAS